MDSEFYKEKDSEKFRGTRLQLWSVFSKRVIALEILVWSTETLLKVTAGLNFTKNHHVIYHFKGNLIIFNNLSLKTHSVVPIEKK